MGVLKPAPLLSAALMAVALSGAALVLAGCGGGGGGGNGDPLPGPGGRLDPIYDTQIQFPDDDVISGGLTYHGITIDLEVQFDEATVRDADLRFRAPARVVAVTAGGVAQPFNLPQPLVIEGILDGSHFETELFGPIRFGSASVITSLSGTLDTGRRHIDGTAVLFGTSSVGRFSSVCRRRYLLAGTDLQSVGEASLVEARYDAQFSQREQLATTSADPVARFEDGRPFIVNRLSYDNLQGLDPTGDFGSIFQYTTGNGSNPHDLAVVDGLAFVTRYEPPYDDVGIFSLENGSLKGSIDLVPYARNADHLPRPDQILLHDGLLYVTLQDANRSFTEFMNGRVAIIDPVSRTVTGVIDLAGQNPFESLAFSPETGRIYVGLAGIFPGLKAQALTGGVEAVDPATGLSLGLVVDDDDLGGNVSGMAIVSETRGYAVVTDKVSRNFLKGFDPETGVVTGTVLETTDRLSAVVADDGWLLVAVGSFVDPRLLVLDGATLRLLASLPLRLPPQSVTIMRSTL